MKSNIIRTVLLVLAFTPLFRNTAYSQGASLQGFSVKISPGSMVYYGDLSTNNLNLPKRIATASKFGFGAGIVKQFTPFFGIQAQFAAGSLYNPAADNTFFAGSLNEFSLSARFDPIRLIKKRTFNISPYFSAGVATIGFRSVRREQGTNVVILPNFGYNQDGVTNARQQTAMSMPLAIGVSYKILPFLQIELEHGVRMTNTDLLDCFKGPGTMNDLYSLTTIGFRFSIPARSVRKPEPITNNPSLEGRAEENLATDAPDLNLFIDCDMPETISPGQSFDVKLRINKGKFNGQAKLIQKLPEGFKATENPRYSNSFLFSNQTVIIEWRQMPADSTVIYDYHIESGNKLSGSQTITGRFEYPEAGSQKTIRFNKTIYIDNNKNAGQQVASENPGAKTDLKSDAGRTPGSVIRQREPLAGIEFRVQCGAFRENDKADVQLARKHNISEIIQEEYTGGWYKYTIGSFRTYEEAVRYRDSFIQRTKIESAFIVAYKDGHRLSNIAEAFK